MAKVVAAVWRTEFLNSLPRQLFCTKTILKKRMNSSFSLNHPGAIHPILQIVVMQNNQRGKELNPFCPPKQKGRALPLLLSLSFFYGQYGIMGTQQESNMDHICDTVNYSIDMRLNGVTVVVIGVLLIRSWQVQFCACV